jgi:hypothetical protein
MGNETALPPDIREALNIANAAAIGEQPAILANLALASQIFNTTVLQQNLIRQQHATSQLLLALTAKSVSLVQHAPLSGAKPDELRPLLDFIRNIMEESNKADQKLVEALTVSLEKARETAAAAKPSESA